MSFFIPSAKTANKPDKKTCIMLCIKAITSCYLTLIYSISSFLCATNINYERNSFTVFTVRDAAIVCAADHSRNCG